MMKRGLLNIVRVSIGLLVTLTGISSSRVLADPLIPADSIETVSTEDIREFQLFLLPEVMALLERARVDIRISKTKLLESPKDSGKTTPTKTAPDILPDGTLSPVPERHRSILYPELGGESEELAYQVLWNTHSRWWGSRLRSWDFSYESHILRPEQQISAYYGTFERLFDDEGSFVSRSLFSVKRPKLLADYSWLRFRSLSREPDSLWLYSPLLNSVRQLPAANSSDPFVGEYFSFDDMLGFSEQIQGLKVRNIRAQTLFFPVEEGIGSVQNGKGKECLEVHGSRLANEQNFSASESTVPHLENLPYQFRMPVVFLPRTVWRIELNVQDPYRNVGKEVLYIDSESYLPVAKVVYNRGGLQLRFFLSSLRKLDRSTLPDAPYSAWTMGETVALRPEVRDGFGLLSFRVERSCDGSESDNARFSPAGLVPKSLNPE